MKRAGMLAVLIPAIMMLSIQIAIYTSSIWAILAITAIGGFAVFKYVYKFIHKLDDKAWVVQLNNVIEKVSTPVIIADSNYRISFANQSFNKLPLATLLASVDNILDLITVKDNKLNASVKDTLDALKGKVKCHLMWQDKSYICSLMPLISPADERWGILLECHIVDNQEINIELTSKSFGTLDQANTSPSFIHFEIENEEKSDIIEKAIQQTSHPLMILDENQCIKQTSDNFVALFNQDKDANKMQHIGVNIVDIMQGFAPELVATLENALAAHKSTTFVAEHFNQICDWVITPIKANGNDIGTIVEILYPSKQELKALEENVARVESTKDEIEKELRHFTQGLANCKLYQKGNESYLEGFNSQDYNHPLIKNSSKIIHQLYSDLNNLHNEIDTVKNSLENNRMPDNNAYIAPLKQVNALSNTLSRNVFEAEQDLTALHQEISKLKGLLGEQKGLNQVYMKPLSRALGATEQALIKTVNHSETVTLILQQIHENQTFVTQLQEFIVKLSKLPRNMESPQTSEIYKEIIGLLDRVKNTLSVGKLKLKELLINFDGLNNCWKQAQENLQACLHTGTSIDQSSKRCSAMSNTAYDYSQLIQDKIAQIVEITNHIQEKTTTAEIVVESSQHTQSTSRQFNKMVIEVDETKKKAEDVLLEGLAKY